MYVGDVEFDEEETLKLRYLHVMAEQLSTTLGLPYLNPASFFA